VTAPDLATLRATLKAAAQRAELPRGDGNWGWHYDSGITDNGPPIERGKSPVVETIENGRHVLIADPYDFDDWPRMDAVGEWIAAASPQNVLALEEALKLIGTVTNVIGEQWEHWRRRRDALLARCEGK
jgi:hypothetical protein